MAILSANALTLADHAKRMDPDGKTPAIVELLSQTNEVLDDMLFIEGNLPTGHRTTVRTGLPSVYWRILNQGTQPSKSTTAQIDESVGILESWSECDVKVAELNGNVSAFRLSEAQAFLEAMNQEFSSTLFYGNSSVASEEFNGLSVRYGDLSAANAKNIIDGGGTGSDNTSIWFVTWGDNQTQLLYPKGTQAGVSREDKGSQRLVDGNGNAYYGKEELFRWNVGLAVKDWRYNVRIANIDVSEVAAGSVALYDFMRKAYWQLQSRRVAGGKQCIYCNRDIMEGLDALQTNAGASDSFIRLKPMEIEGKEVLTYRGIPIRETDALLNTEALVA